MAQSDVRGLNSNVADGDRSVKSGVPSQRARVSTRRLAAAVVVGAAGGMAGAAALPGAALAGGRIFANRSCKSPGWVGASTLTPHSISAFEGAFSRCSNGNAPGWGRAWFKHSPNSPGTSTGTEYSGTWGTGFVPADVQVRTYAKLNSRPTNEYKHHFYGGYNTR
jgi:hypothetical protein